MLQAMRWVLRCVAVVVLAVALTSSWVDRADAQQLQDVVYLRDGSIIRGTIIEQVPGESILIRTTDGNQFRYQMAQIDRITKEPVAGGGAPAPSRQMVGRKSPGVAFLLSFLITGGGQVYNGQYAKAGIMFGGSVISLGIALSSWEDCWDFDDCGAFTAGVIGAVGFGLASWIDAPISASSINRRLDAGLALDIGPRLHPGVSLKTGSRYAVGLAPPETVQSRVGVSLARLRF
jgi:hypothetical protein